MLPVQLKIFLASESIFNVNIANVFHKKFVELKARRLVTELRKIENTRLHHAFQMIFERFSFLYCARLVKGRYIAEIFSTHVVSYY